MPWSQLSITIPNKYLVSNGQQCITNNGVCSLTQTSSTVTLTFVSFSLQSPLIITSGLSNPSIAVLQSISSSVQITNQEYQVATQSTNLFIVPPLQSSTTITGSLQQTGLIAGQPTTLTITLTKSQAIGNSVLLTIPNSVYITGNPICTVNSINTQCLILQQSNSIKGYPVFVLQLSVKVQSLTQTQTIIVISGLYNTDIPSSILNKSITLQMINQNTVVASCVLQLQPLSIPLITPKLTRQNTQPGMGQVRYILQFSATTFIRSQDYFVMVLPYDQAVTSPLQLSCQDSTTGYSVSCRSSKDTNFQYLTIQQFCANQLCLPTQQLQLILNLQNPSTLVALQSCYITLYSSQNEILAQSVAFQATPALDGIVLSLPSLKRVTNLIGNKDSLQVFIDSLSVSIISATDLIIDLPDLLTYGQVNSTRGQVVQKNYTSGAVSQIQLLNVCNQSLLCISYQSMAIKLGGLTNPQTNLMLNQTVKYTLRQSSIEAGLILFQANLAPMQPPVSSTITFSGQCYTSQPCNLTVNIQATNPITSYLELTSALPFLSCSNCLILNLNQLRYYGTGNTIQIQLLQLQIPNNAVSLSNQFTAKSFEQVLGQFMLLETFTTKQSLNILPSPFVNITIRRTNAALGAITDIRVFLQTKFPKQGDTLKLLIPRSEGILTSAICVAYSTGLSIPCNITDNQITLSYSYCAQQSCVLVIQNVLNPKTVQQAAQAQATLYKAQQIAYQQSVFITPALIPSVLLLTDTTYTPQQTNYGQPIQLSFSFQSDYFGNYMQVTFAQFTPANENLKVTVNSQSMQIVDITATSFAFSLPQAVFNSVVINGLIANNIGSLQSVLQVDLLVQRGDQIASQTSTASIAISTVSIQPITAYLSNPYVNSTTYLYLSSTTPGTSVLTTSLQFGNIQCTDFDLKTLQCSVKNNKISWTGDSVIMGPFKTTTSLTELFTLQGVIQQVVAQSQFQLPVYQIGYCTSSSCKRCSSTQQCTECNQGYVLDQGQCVLICGNGEFAAQGYCFQCDYECVQCQQQSSCTICSDFMVGGQCLSTCPEFYYALNGECVHNSTQSVIDCTTAAYQQYNGTNLNCTPEQVVCVDEQCAECSYSANYCDSCKIGLVSLNGQCVQNCPVGFFEHNRSCYVCNPTCKQCTDSANNCLGCKAGLTFTQGYATCVDECPTGTFMSQNQCEQCDYSCNSCSAQHTCTSCYKQFQTDLDLYLNGNDCVSTCPFGMTTDYIQHLCYYGQSVLQWTSPLIMAALMTVFAITSISRCFGKQMDRKYWVASALLNLIDFVNRVVLAGLLWSTTEIGGFTVTGVYALGCSVAGIYESQVVYIAGRPNYFGLLTSATGPYTTRLLLGNPFGKYQTITHRRGIPWSQFETCCTMQSVLTLMQLINSIVIFTRFGYNEAVFGFAVNSFAICAFQLWLQLMAKHCDRKLPTVPKHSD